MKWNDPTTYWDGKACMLMLGIFLCLLALNFVWCGGLSWLLGT